jgi:hypothetical protein
MIKSENGRGRACIMHGAHELHMKFHPRKKKTLNARSLLRDLIVKGSIILKW